MVSIARYHCRNIILDLGLLNLRGQAGRSTKGQQRRRRHASFVVDSVQSMTLDELLNIGPTKANGAAPEQGRLSNLCPEGIAGGLVLVGDVDGDVANFVGSLLAPSVGERVPNVYDIGDDLGDEGSRSSDPDEGKLIRGRHLVQYSPEMLERRRSPIAK